MSERVVLRCESCELEVSRRADAVRHCWDCGDAMRLIRKEATVLSGDNDSRQVVTPVQFDDWPIWAKTLRRLRKAEDKGVGDTVQRIAAWFGGERFKTFSSKIGLPCGCTERQADWNKTYTYESEQ